MGLLCFKNIWLFSPSLKISKSGFLMKWLSFCYVMNSLMIKCEVKMTGYSVSLVPFLWSRTSGLASLCFIQSYFELIPHTFSWYWQNSEPHVIMSLTPAPCNAVLCSLEKNCFHLHWSSCQTEMRKMFANDPLICFTCPCRYMAIKNSFQNLVVTYLLCV